MDGLAFHYCSVEIFFSIITNKTLRLSDVVKSNDNLEVTWIKKVLLNMIKEETLLYENFDERIKSKISEDLYKDKLREKIDCFFDKKEIKSKFFAICFSGSESEDMLSQWRGYGDDGKGIAIGFNRRILEKTQKTFVLNSDKSQIKFRKVEYEEEIQKENIRQFWKKQINIANRNLEKIELDFEFWMIQSFYKLYLEAIFMKNPFFKEENESRIVYEKGDQMEENNELVNKMQIGEGKVAIRNGNIVEYYDLDISKLLNGFIQKIILGPKCKLEQEDVRMLMKRFGYQNIEVVWSKGSYR